MSAEDQGNTPVDAGPVIITVPGQDGHVSNQEVVAETPPAEVEVEVKKEATGSEEQVEAEDRDAKGRFKPGVQNRIDELTRARREAEREVEHWKSLAQGKQAPAQEVAAEVPPANDPPSRDQFQSDEEYIDALADHKVEVKLAEREERARIQKDSTEKAVSWQSKLEAARNDIPDFNEVMDNAELPLGAHVAGLLMDHKDGAKVAHHLAKHPEKLDQINSMTPAQAAFTIAEIGLQFKSSESASSSEPAVVTKKVSEAPPPAARNVGSGRATTPSLNDMSMDDYVKTRRAQGASWAR